MINRIYDNIDFYKKALDGTWERHKAINNNIANDNTPNYKRKFVTFEDQLKQSIENNRISLTKTHVNHINHRTSSFSPIVMEDKSTSYRLDGNNVNIDTETADLAKNTIMYDALTKQVIGEFEKIKNVITEGSK
ncbi:flagellar basal body rod protein FlgB [Tissierella praeacuta]|uniref:Flagellar basal body rod protein FlgB n=1 Tax=Tissierella praeacuta DSM 18095 TaxID=1123404 RepID=A0A1M4SMF9_9FIRM|nr:flagellar basal body rod protein FlgB [Tissierella praeacuta]MBU5254747.1 flagellar basal body rod protein FlgB [Tissierella praeacuta]TCU70597.1 flagellar basal-body rod protein FlgB [Tissierella praeacuta]SHE33342.1 flagellar basal-body rod protein FlgB [Tissierella praeacuta DSM 18095]SUP01569.1 Flagellar basal body rod protein FlgB [Tissierella praeacuta]